MLFSSPTTKQTFAYIAASVDLGSVPSLAGFRCMTGLGRRTAAAFRPTFKCRSSQRLTQVCSLLLKAAKSPKRPDDPSS